MKLWEILKKINRCEKNSKSNTGHPSSTGIFSVEPIVKNTSITFIEKGTILVDGTLELSSTNIIKWEKNSDSISYSRKRFNSFEKLFDINSKIPYT